MKRMIILMMAVAMLFSFAACASASAASLNEIEKTVIPGSYEKADSPEISDEIRDLIERASADKLGVNYIAVALLASQIVNGTNYMVLCKIQPVVPGAAAHYAIVVVHEGLDGSAQILDILDSDAEAAPSGLIGGYSEAVSPVMNEEAAAALDKALEGLVGARYEAVALLASQLVNGRNYSILCEISPVVPNAESHYAIVQVYQDLQGNAQIANVSDFIAE